MAAVDRHPKLIERAAQPFEQKGASANVFSEQPWAPLPVGEPQHLDLVRRRVGGARNDQLEDSWGTVVTERLDNASLG